MSYEYKITINNSVAEKSIQGTNKSNLHLVSYDIIVHSKEEVRKPIKI